MSLVLAIGLLIFLAYWASNTKVWRLKSIRFTRKRHVMRRNPDHSRQIASQSMHRVSTSRRQVATRSASASTLRSYQRTASSLARSRLNTLTKDKDTSQRLIDGVVQKHPERSLHWCIEKAIVDFERDRFR